MSHEACKCVKSVTYKTDDGKDAFAFVLSLHAANEVPADSDRLS